MLQQRTATHARDTTPPDPPPTLVTPSTQKLASNRALAALPASVARDDKCVPILFGQRGEGCGIYAVCGEDMRCGVRRCHRFFVQTSASAIDITETVVYRNVLAIISHVFHCLFTADRGG